MPSWSTCRTVNPLRSRYFGRTSECRSSSATGPALLSRYSEVRRVVGAFLSVFLLATRAFELPTTFTVSVMVIPVLGVNALRLPLAPREPYRHTSGTSTLVNSGGSVHSLLAR